MRFKTSVRNIQTFSKLTASLSSLGKVAWVRLDDDNVRFTIIPETGTQVWAVLSIDSIFEDYTIQSAAQNNTINLELPLPPLHRALKSAINATSASIRLTKKDGVPVLSLTIITNTISSGNSANGFLNGANPDPFGDNAFREENLDANMAGDRETIVTQNIPIRVLTADSVEGIHEPRVREPDAHIILPSLIQLKAISDRFTKLAMATTTGGTKSGSAASVPKLELAANMHGSLKLSISTDALNISSVWTGLSNPELDPRQVEDGEDGIGDHPSTKLKAAGPDAWSTVRIDGRDWGKVLSVGRLGGRVIACFADDHALILYVYLSNYDDGSDDSVLTYYISSFSS
ncbi:cell cycle checkpoint protein-like protein [Mollisia scopiformis]|uniref:Checkpoint protein n=1 Tax=Mollisia scopiformis TaxID=149040 RepID=A0A194XIT9_MOLSC|nr:cell cycle checkpoint protein-like protein [Mollisia scopiformis]KUJ20078.1 cell cycle checkpoint protein-like protein [Mollisia scopiformis]